MELHQLRYLVSVAETQNFTRAAERSAISQPSLSQQIINLETELGHKLFHRLGRRAVPTEAGAVFLERARRILTEVENATKEIRDDPSLDRSIVVGAIPTSAPYLLPRVIERCRSEHPNLLVHTREDFRAPLTRGVVDGELDLAIISLPLKEHAVSVETIFTEPLLLAVGRQHPLAAKPNVVATDLATETFVLLGPGSTLTSETQRFCGDHDFVPKLGYECSQVATVKAFVGLGLGISILPLSAKAPEDKETLVYRKLSGRAPQRDIAIIRHLQRYQSRGAQQFIAVLKEIAKDLPAH